MKTFYFCKTDAYGQRTGIVEEINIKPILISTDRYGGKYYNEIYLYESHEAALVSALS